MPHVLRQLKSKLDSDRKERSTLCLLVVQCLWSDGRVREAVQWLEESCQWRSGLDKAHPDRLMSQHALAIAYNEYGEVTKAVALLEHIVAVDENLLHETDPGRLASQATLATAYQADGQAKKPVAQLDYVTLVEERTLSDDHIS